MQGADGTAWLRAARVAAAQLPAADRLHVEGLRVELRANDAAALRWVRKSMQPLSSIPAHASTREYSLSLLYCDDTVSEAIRNLNDIGIVRMRKHGRDHFLRLARPASETTVYCDPDEGVVWISDRMRNAVILLVSARTKHPAMALASLTRDVVNAHLAAQGWTLFHAGAVDTDRGALMVVGNGGAGKTSLLLALMCGAARFIANELLYARAGEDGLRVLGYPMPIAVGLGTAMQFPALAERIDSPGELEFPRHRLKLSRVVHTPRKQWQDLDDKLQLLPVELCQLLGAPAAVAGGALCGVVVPRVGVQAMEPSIEYLSSVAVQRVLAHNHLGLAAHSRHRPWMELNLESCNGMGRNGVRRLLGALGALTPVRVHFGLSLETFERNSGYAQFLLDAQARAPLAALAA
jgi:hypothetical protein